VLYLRADQDEDHPSGTSQSRVEHAPKGINKKKTIKNKTNSLKLYINSIIANSGLLNKCTKFESESDLIYIFIYNIYKTLKIKCFNISLDS